jgi:hypothetical protein
VGLWAGLICTLVWVVPLDDPLSEASKRPMSVFWMVTIFRPNYVRPGLERLSVFAVFLGFAVSACYVRRLWASSDEGNKD